MALELAILQRGDMRYPGVVASRLISLMLTSCPASIKFRNLESGLTITPIPVAEMSLALSW